MEIKLSIPLSKGGVYTTTYNITGVAQELEKKKNAKLTNPRMTLGFSLDFLGFPYVSRAELLLDKEVKKTAVDLIDEDDKKKEEGEKKEEEKKKEEGEKKEEEKVETKIKTVSRTLKVESVGINSKSLLHNKEGAEESARILSIFASYETFLKRNSETKNRLESLIYKIQEMVENENLIQYATEEEKATLSETATKLDDWMFSDEAAQGNYTLYTQKYKEYSVNVTKIE